MQRSQVVSPAFLIFLPLAVLPYLGCHSKVAETPAANLADVEDGLEVANFDKTRGADATEPERWLDTGKIAPKPLAIQPQGHRALVTVGYPPYLSILYNLESGDELRIWLEGFVSAGFSTDGRRLLTVGTYVSVWDAETGDEIRCIQGLKPSPEDPMLGATEVVAALNGDGSLVAISNGRGSFDRRLPHGVLLFDVASGRLRTTLAMPLATRFHSLAFADNGRRLLVEYWQSRPAGRDGSGSDAVLTGALWNTQDGKPVRQFPEDAIARVSQFPEEATARVSPDGRWIATKSRDRKTLAIWAAATGERVQTLEQAHTMYDFAFSPDCRKVLVAVNIPPQQEPSWRYEGRIIEWDWRSAKKLVETDSKKWCARVAYSPDGKRRFALTEEVNQLDDNVYRFRGWKVETGTELPIRDYRVSYNMIYDVYFFPEGDRFINIGYVDYEERDIFSGEAARRLPMRRAETRNAAFAPDGEMMLTARRLTNLRSGKQREWHLPSHGGEETFVANGHLLFVCDDKCVYLIDVVSSEIVWQFLLDMHKIDTAISRDGRYVAVSTGSSRYTTRSPRLVLINTSVPDGIKVLQRLVFSLSFHPENLRYVEASPDAIHECDAGSGVRIRSLFNVLGRTLDLCYSSEGRRVLACGVVGREDPRELVDSADEGWTMLWDDDTGEAIQLEGHTAPVVSCAFSPDSTRCATGSLDRTIRLWDTIDGNLLHTFRGHLGQLNSIVYNPCGGWILSAGQDGAALWNVAQFATPAVKPFPLAADFRVVERATATPWFNAPGQTNGLVVPVPPGYQPASISHRQAEGWTAVMSGKTPYRSLTSNTTRMLSMLCKPAATIRCTIPSLPSTVAGYGRNYDLLDTSRDEGRKLYISGPERSIILSDRNGEILRKWDAPVPYTRRLALSPSGEEVVIAREIPSENDARRFEITIQDAVSGLLIREFYFEDNRNIGWIRMGPEEATIMLRMAEGAIVLLDYQTGNVRGEVSEPTRAALTAVFSPDGRYIAVDSLHGKVTLYDRATLTACKEFLNPLDVRTFQFSPDGKRLVVSQTSELLTMWDVDSSQQRWTRQAYSQADIVFSQDGRMFMTRVDHTVRALWDTDEGRLIAVFLGIHNHIVFSRDGKSLHLGTPEGPLVWSEE